MPSQAALEHQAEQVKLMALVARELSRTLPALSSPRLTLDVLVSAIYSIVETYGAMSGDIATDFYRRERRAQGVLGRFSPRIAELPPLEQVEKSVEWASKDILTRPERERTDEREDDEPDDDEESSLEDLLRELDEEEDLDAAATKLQGVTDKMILDVGRNTLLENIERDRQAKAWARIPEANCCAFCALLSTRGAVYKTEETASFEAHDHCRCNVEPLFGEHYEMTAQVREWEALYKKATSEAPPGANKINEFRRHFEGREDAPRRKSGPRQEKTDE